MKLFGLRLPAAVAAASSLPGCMCSLYSLGACGTGHVCVVMPASLARHFDDVDLRYFYFSQSCFASLNLAQPPDTVDISHYTGLQYCLNLLHASCHKEPENSQLNFEHILCHMCQLVQSEGGNRASTAGTTRAAIRNTTTSISFVPNTTHPFPVSFASNDTS